MYLLCVLSFKEKMMNLDARFDAWVAKQDGIYQKFDQDRAIAVRETGMKPDSVIADKKGGYLIALRLNSEIADQIDLFCQEAKQITPDLAMYNAQTVHTTISDYLVAPGFVPPERAEHYSTLEKLSRSIRFIGSLGEHALSCTYNGGFTFNQTTLILKGNPSQSFLGISEYTIEQARLSGLELRLPWGAHVTCGRATKDIDVYAVKELSELCDRFVITSKAFPSFYSADVGWFTSDEDGFHPHFVGKHSFLQMIL